MGLPFSKFSLRSRIMAGVLSTAVAGFAAVVITARLFHDISYNNQKAALTELVGLRISSQLKELEEITKSFGLELQSDSSLRNAITNRDSAEIQVILDSQFQRFYITSGKLNLINILIFDQNYQLISQSSKSPNDGKLMMSCEQLVFIASRRKGVDRLKPISKLCHHSSGPQFGVVVPVDSLNPFAYMMLIADPANNVSQIEKMLGDPIKIVKPDDSVIFQSSIWPSDQQLSDFLVTHYTIRLEDGNELFTTFAARDIEPYRKQLIDKTLVILGICTFLFALVLWAVIYTLRKSLTPLDELQRASSLLVRGEFVEVTSTDIPEINFLVQSFNRMSSDISKLINKLQTEIFQHKKTEERLRKNQADLSMARDQAFSASRAKSSFLANMSHELRTPLNAIIGYSEILYEDVKDSNNHQQLGDLRSIKTAGKHLLSLINDILDLSKIESGQLDLKLDSFDIRSFISDAVSDIQPLIKKNKNKLAVQCEANIGSMYSDETKLRHSLLNLLDNAAKFTNNGDIVLLVSKEKRNGEDWIQFSVSDTGIGISEQQSRRLFSEFTQLDSSSTKSYGGAGLGLTLSQRFCELMGGHITFSSEIDKGSVFTISLPRKSLNKSIIDRQSITVNEVQISKSA